MAEYVDKDKLGKAIYHAGGENFYTLGVLSLLRDFPTADVAPVRHGRWIWDLDGMDCGLGAWCCSECKSKAETWWANDKKYIPLRCSGGHFCGNCGAKMDGEEDKNG